MYGEESGPDFGLGAPEPGLEASEPQVDQTECEVTVGRNGGSGTEIGRAMTQTSTEATVFEMGPVLPTLVRCGRSAELPTRLSRPHQ